MKTSSPSPQRPGRWWLILSRIYYSLNGASPLNPAVWIGRLSPIVFRRIRPEDLAGCLELYSLNEPKRFPENMKDHYERSLLAGDTYYLVAEIDGQIVASGGLSYVGREGHAVLSYGLVHPSHQRKGIGTALFLARLALLRPNGLYYRIFIFALRQSMGYYRRFGFTGGKPWKDIHGELHPSGNLFFSPNEILRCRALLNEHKIIYPQDEDQIPVRTRAASNEVADR
jgi:GNAT superfamily N-acetyltransferase